VPEHLGRAGKTLLTAPDPAMSNTPSITSNPDTPEPAQVAAVRAGPVSSEGPTGPVDQTPRWLREELAGTTDKSRQSRLLTELANLAERAGDEPGAARDYLAAYNADPSFREPLESLIRLLEKRRSLRNLGRLVDAVVRAATTPDERVRALLMRAFYQADAAGEIGEAQSSAREATDVDGARNGELATAWLSLEVLSGRAGDVGARDEALARRTDFAGDPTWKALLLIDRARLTSGRGELVEALGLLEQARSLGSKATWTATTEVEHVLRAAGPTGEPEAHAEARAAALEATAGLIEEALRDGARGDALGVPHWVREPARLIDALLRAADMRRALKQLDHAAATLERAVAQLAVMPPEQAALVDAAVTNARIRIAEAAGQGALAAELSDKRLAQEKDRGLVAALALQVALDSIARGEPPRALEALAKALAADPASLPVRALELELLTDGDPGLFAAQLESMAEQLATDEARGNLFLLAAYVWVARASDVSGAKAALSQAAMYGVPHATTGRVARALASIAGDAGWYEEATKRLLSAGGTDDALSLCVELLRLRQARGDAEGAARALHDMAGAPRGAWLSRVLEAFSPQPPAAAQPEPERRGSAPDARETPTASAARARHAVEELAAHESDPDLARGLGLVAAMRAMAGGDTEAARKQLRQLADRDASDAVVVSFLGDLDRAAGDHGAAARNASDGAAATTDAALAAALRLEAGFERWRAGDRKLALEEIEAAAAGAPEAAKIALAWASRGVDVDSPDARRRAIEFALEASGPSPALALERFALELGGGDVGDAAQALGSAEQAPDGDVGLAASLARLVWPPGLTDSGPMEAALDRIEARGGAARRFGAAERVRMTRDSGDLEGAAQAARRWFDAGGGLTAALEWLAAAGVVEQPAEERDARAGMASQLTGEAREAMLASAALLDMRIRPDEPIPLVPGGSPAAQLANLELAPPGCDPRRRVTGLTGLGAALGEDAGADARALSGWSSLAASDLSGARAAFEAAAAARPGDLAAWEGLRAVGELTGDPSLRAQAASELGARCHNPERGAALWEEAALLWIGVGQEDAADRALYASFERDPRRAVAFDKLFRRVRDRKDNDRLLELVSRRLEVTDEPPEIQKLFWEQARVLREKGDQEGALVALEHVTMLDPDHVGALALLGEINIRRAQFDEAAASLGRLSTLEAAPPKNRLTAGVAAADIYENKLDRADKALEVLLGLHRANLSTLPVRERLARAAARVGAWADAVPILEALMTERPTGPGRLEAARLAVAIYRDRLGRPQEATRAIAKVLEESPGDGEGLDVLFDSQQPREVVTRLAAASRPSVVARLSTNPTSVPDVVRLVKIARAVNDGALQQAALQALVTLGAADGQAEQALGQLLARKPRAPKVAIPDTMLRSMIAPGDAGAIADLFVLLGPTLAEALGPNLQALGVGRRDRVDPRSGLALRNEIATWAGAFGLQEFDLYVGGREDDGVQGIPGEPPAIVVGAGVKAPLSPGMRARVAREVLGILRGTSILRSRDEVTIAAIVVTACRLGEVQLNHPPYAVLAEVERVVGKAIPRRTRKALPDVVRNVARSGQDGRAWSHRALVSQDRVATLASGDAATVLALALGVPPGRLGQATVGNARAGELLRFVLSPEYLDLRRALGLEGDE
jgi:tetratricopeptide (TPR) repeat protein